MRSVLKLLFTLRKTAKKRWRTLERYFRGAKGDYYCSSDPAHFAKNVEPTTSANSGEVDRPVLRVSAQVTQAIHYAPGFLIEQGQHFRLPIASRDREREFVDYKR